MHYWEYEKLLLALRPLKLLHVYQTHEPLLPLNDSEAAT